MAILRKLKLTLAKAAAQAESDEEAVDGFAPRSFADNSETTSGYFCGNIRRMIPQKPEGQKRAVGQTARFRTAGARGQGECNPHWQS